MFNLSLITRSVPFLRAVGACTRSASSSKAQDVHKALMHEAQAAEEWQKRFKEMHALTQKPDSWFVSLLKRCTPPKFSLITPSVRDLKNVQIANNCAAAATIGRRSEMQDTHVFSEFNVNGEKITLTGVFDGHGGAAVAAHAANKIAETFMENLDANVLSDENIWEAIQKTFVQLSDTAPDPEAGSTANVVFKIQNSLWIANAGDSRAIVIDHQGDIFGMSRDTTLAEPEFANRVKERGGWIETPDLDPLINGRLRVGGALGNHWALGAISPEPLIHKIKADDRHTVIQFTDGLSDVADPYEIAERVGILAARGFSKEEIARDLAGSAHACGSKDNITVLLS